MIDFKPSQVDLNGSFPPLCATLGRVEREAVATLIARVCQEDGDAWRPVTPREIGERLKADHEAKREPLYSLSTNPFWRPDVWDCVKEGYVRWTEWMETDDGKGPVELTKKGLEALRRWVSVAALHVDEDPDDWTVRRGAQTIEKKKV